MLQMIRGCTVPDPTRLSESYEANGQGFTANVNAGKIETLFRDFIKMQNEQLFFILEIPTSKDEEERLCKAGSSSLHKDVYYIDWLSADDAAAILDEYGELLIHDGLSCFGFGVQNNSAEIMLYKYNTVDIWAKKPEEYKDFFKTHGIAQTNSLVSAWHTFSPENPGISSAVEVGGVRIFDLPEKLKSRGIYFAECREE